MSKFVGYQIVTICNNFARSLFIKHKSPYYDVFAFFMYFILELYSYL